ncbi:hypothetical protein [Alkalihalobacillus trypoxylicola]|uniref:Bacteriophage SP-beta YorD domain-containing protein n=1 Tax=Alkalihalobacillus trypoxylicola TaxID=519424 RepID=A0A162EW81_9BACI|nr:hypothetical protein [Alkalihalobacillus trypoxylicola]KYG33884.1 hypothetical protein AZF04_15330 [Alkalihalobacillus trypoxylicola]
MKELKTGLRFNSKGEIIEQILIDESDLDRPLPPNVTLVPLPEPNWKPIFDKDKNEWVETITEEELNELNSPLNVPGPLELLAQQNTDLEIQSMEQGQQITDMHIEQMIQGQIQTDMELRLLMLEVN